MLLLTQTSGECASRVLLHTQLPSLGSGVDTQRPPPNTPREPQLSTQEALSVPFLDTNVPRATPWDNKEDTGKEAGRKHSY